MNKILREISILFILIAVFGLSAYGVKSRLDAQQQKSINDNTLRLNSLDYPSLTQKYIDDDAVQHRLFGNPHSSGCKSHAEDNYIKFADLKSWSGATDNVGYACIKQDSQYFLRTSRARYSDDEDDGNSHESEFNNEDNDELQNRSAHFSDSVEVIGVITGERVNNHIEINGKAVRLSESLLTSPRMVQRLMVGAEVEVEGYRDARNGFVVTDLKPMRSNRRYQDLELGF